MLELRSLSSKVTIDCSRPGKPIGDGVVADLNCNKCGNIIPVKTLATRLINAFCGVGSGGPDILEAIAALNWGDGLRVGRHDWVLADFPTELNDFQNGLETMSGVKLSALCRLLGTTTFKEFFSDFKEEISQAVIRRFSKDLVRIPPMDFERLIRVLNDYPTKSGYEFFENIRENYLNEWFHELVSRFLNNATKIKF